MVLEYPSELMGFGHARQFVCPLEILFLLDNLIVIGDKI